jgi:hypothetical protein
MVQALELAVFLVAILVLLVFVVGLGEYQELF